MATNYVSIIGLDLRLWSTLIRATHMYRYMYTLQFAMTRTHPLFVCVCEGNDLEKGIIGAIKLEQAPYCITAI